MQNAIAIFIALIIANAVSCGIGILIESRWNLSVWPVWFFFFGICFHVFLSCLMVEIAGQLLGFEGILPPWSVSEQINKMNF